jgi:nitroreductase
VHFLKKIFNAARLAPSSNNEQPRRFLIGIKGKDRAYPKLFDALNQWNQTWAIHAPVLAVVVAKMTSDKNATPNRHAMYDCGQALAYLTLQAAAEGLFVH